MYKKKLDMHGEKYINTKNCLTYGNNEFTCGFFCLCEASFGVCLEDLLSFLELHVHFY